MCSEKYDNFGVTFNKLQQKVEVFKQKRYELNKKIEDYISSYQNIETEINESYLIIKKIYDKRRYYCNEKIKRLRNKRNEYQNLLDNLIEKKKSLQKPKIDHKRLKNINSLKNSIIQINHKIGNLEDTIKTDNLNINEENEVVDKIRKLEDIKHEKINLITKKEQEQVIVQQNNEFNINQRKIEFIKPKLKNISEQLSKWSNKKQKNQNLTIDLFQKVYKLRDNKKKMEKELIENRRASERYYFQFSKILHCEKESSKKKKPYKRNKRQKLEPGYVLRIKNRELLKKLKQEKLKIALEKQKAGKRLDIHEYRLIMEQ